MKRTTLMHKCENRRCGWRGTADQLLIAPHPFLPPPAKIFGCPNCKDAECIVDVCDEEGCFAAASCGTPDNDGIYRRTCFEHAPLRDRFRGEHRN
jgi:hypothetical protein